MARIAIIPARGGSKRIPRKNIIPFQGRPMISWSISAALDTGLFDRVLVSTEDEEIAAISRAVGAEVPFLRQCHSDDHTPVSLATLTALEQAETHWGEHFDEVVQLMPNCPLRGGDELAEATAFFQAGAHEFQISVFEFGWMNPWWAMRRRPDGTPEPLFPNARQTRSQDLDRLYCPTGAIWIATSAGLRAHRSFYGPGHVILPMPWESALDIDDFDDLRFAEAVATMRAQGSGLATPREMGWRKTE